MLEELLIIGFIIVVVLWFIAMSLGAKAFIVWLFVVHMVGLVKSKLKDMKFDREDRELCEEQD